MQVIPALESGGVEVGTLQIAEAIVKAGGRSIIAAKEGSMAKGLRKKGIQFIELPLQTKNPFQISKNVNLLKQLIKKEKVDILHVRSRAPAWSAYKAAHISGIPFVTTYHAAYRSQTVIKTFYNSIMARGDRVIAISQFIADHINQKYKARSWFNPEKVCLIHRGIDFQFFDPKTISKENLEYLRKSWSVPRDAKILLLPGRVCKKKGQDVLIKALSLMKATNVYVFFIGSAKNHERYLKKLLNYANSLDLEGRVQWLPPIQDLPIAYQLADVIVCPSIAPEGFGRLMAEAQAMGKPIITSDHGAAREIVLEGETGWFTSPGDATTLASILDEVLSIHPEKLDKMGKKARAHIEENFSNDAMCKKTLGVYQELLNEKAHLA